MLHQELPPIGSGAGDHLGRWLVPSLACGAGLSIAVLLLIAGQPMLAGLAVVGGAIAAFAADRRANAQPSLVATLAAGPDFSLLGAALGLTSEPAALTDGDGRLLIANTTYRERFGKSRPPLGLAIDDGSLQGLEAARAIAWRDGAGCAAGIETEAGRCRSRSSGSGRAVPICCGDSPTRFRPIR